MDVFRVGTLLEMVREMATALAIDGKKVKVCVQGSMGQGVFQGLPLSLSGVRRILEAMDFGEAEAFVSFGAVGAGDIDGADYYILISPQNIVGASIVPYLSAMAEEAEARGKTLILINPNLSDRPSSGGLMGVRGRKERIDFSDSFEICAHYRLLYKAGQYFPIEGALRFCYGGKWEVYDREDLGKGKERYVLKGEFDEEPGGGEITECLKAGRTY
jgi:adenylate kinase